MDSYWYFQILQTIPFDRVKIHVITIHQNWYNDSDYQMYDSEYITQFLQSKSYHLEKIIDQNYIFVLAQGNNKINKDNTAAAKPNRKAGI